MAVNRLAARMAARVLMIAMISTAAAAAEGEEHAPALMPLPRTITFGAGFLPLPGMLTPDWSGCRSAELPGALARLYSDIARLTGTPSDPEKPVRLAIHCETSGAVAHDRHEAYKLTVAEDGVRIDAAGPAGVLRAFATLRQLVMLQRGQPELAFAAIEDAPRFPWRGIMLDVARNFLSVETIERQIDAMERVKLNVLHLHLSDDQGFRVESKRYPKLNAQSPYYTQAQVRSLVTYAADRGVLVVPEFDVPGHTRAIVDAYPEIGLRAAKAVGAFPRDVALNPASPRTYRFLQSLIEEMAPLFPGPYFHIGGDEVSAAAWEDSAEVKALMAREQLATKADVEAYFARRVTKIVRRAGKTSMGWDEITNAGLADDVVIHAWQSSNATAAAVAKGYRTVVSAGYYLDLLMPTDFHYAIDPLDPAAAGFTPEEAERARKASPLIARVLTDAVIAKPLPPLTAEQAQLVLGGEAALWGVQVTDEMADHRLWPRAAALAERFWSPAHVRDASEMYRRLVAVDHQLTVMGLDGDAQRRRMTLRLAPDSAEAVHTLLDIVTPVRNMAHDHGILAALRGQRIVQALNSLADAAPTDSLVAQRFVAQVQQVVAGDRAGETALRAQLTLWRDNDARFAAVARGNAMLAPALPTSSAIAALAQMGLAALDAIAAGTVLDATTTAGAEALLAEAEKHDAASRKALLSFLNAQPPADLIIAITPGIRALIDAAKNPTQNAPAHSAHVPAASSPVGMVGQPCAPTPPLPKAVREFNDALLEPGKPDLPRLLALTRDPEFIAYNEAKKQREAQDWAGLCRYRADNIELLASGARPDVVFIGDSITEGWVRGDAELFSEKVIGRGIGGQTSGQLLVRFHADVIALRPRVVHIMVGTNDVAGNAGPTSERAYQDNIKAMIEVARAHDIRVVLASIPPAARFMWRPEVKPAAQIVRLNAWLRDYAAREGLRYLDYHSILATVDGALRPEFAIDGVHPNRDGYAAMRKLAASVR